MMFGSPPSRFCRADLARAPLVAVVDVQGPGLVEAAFPDAPEVLAMHRFVVVDPETLLDGFDRFARHIPVDRFELDADPVLLEEQVGFRHVIGCLSPGVGLHEPDAHGHVDDRLQGDRPLVVRIAGPGGLFQQHPVLLRQNRYPGLAPGKEIAERQLAGGACGLHELTSAGTRGGARVDEHDYPVAAVDAVDRQLVGDRGRSRTRQTRQQERLAQRSGSHGWHLLRASSSGYPVSRRVRSTQASLSSIPSNSSCLCRTAGNVSTERTR